jgi:hypothetical protein
MLSNLTVALTLSVVLCLAGFFGWCSGVDRPRSTPDVVAQAAQAPAHSAVPRAGVAGSAKDF